MFKYCIEDNLAKPIIGTSNLQKYEVLANITFIQKCLQQKSCQEEIPVVMVNNDPMTRNDFWTAIDSFAWRNRSDGAVNKRFIDNYFNNVSKQRRDSFREHYANVYDLMRESLEKDRIFVRNNIKTSVDEACIISHAIALGRSQYDTLIDDHHIFQFLIENDECQSFDSCLPHDIQMA
jgi:hypothetical protein